MEYIIYILATLFTLLEENVHKIVTKVCKFFSAVTIVGCDPVQVISNFKEHLLNFWLQGKYSSSRPLHGYSWQEPCVHLQPLHQHHRQLRFVCIALYLRTLNVTKVFVLKVSEEALLIHTAMKDIILS